MALQGGAHANGAAARSRLKFALGAHQGQHQPLPRPESPSGTCNATLLRNRSASGEPCHGTHASFGRARLLVAQQGVDGLLALAAHQVPRQHRCCGRVAGGRRHHAGRQQLQALPGALQRRARRLTTPPVTVPCQAPGLLLGSGLN